MNFRRLTQTYRRICKGTVILIGGTVLPIGIAMIVAPGPAVMVIPIGLIILGVEYAWARRWAGAAKQTLQAVMAR